MSAPIEVTTKYATSVPELAEAWAFVMERLDSVGPNRHEPPYSRCPDRHDFPRPTAAPVGTLVGFPAHLVDRLPYDAGVALVAEDGTAVYALDRLPAVILARSALRYSGHSGGWALLTRDAHRRLSQAVADIATATVVPVAPPAAGPDATADRWDEVAAASAVVEGMVEERRGE